MCILIDSRTLLSTVLRLCKFKVVRMKYNQVRVSRVSSAGQRLVASDRPAGKRRLAVLRGVLPRRAGSGGQGLPPPGLSAPGRRSDLRGAAVGVKG